MLEESRVGVAFCPDVVRVVVLLVTVVVDLRVVLVPEDFLGLVTCVPELLRDVFPVDWLTRLLF